MRALGRGPEIGANSYYVQAGGEGVVLDCGLHPKKEGLEAAPDFSPVGADLTAAIVTHAHVDHCGGLPLLLRDHPEAEWYATEPTVRIIDRMLHNSVSVMGTIALERGIRDYPLYTHADVDSVIRRAYGMPLEQEFALRSDSGLRASFHHSGHVLGAACVLLRTPGHTLLYTGDVCLTPQELLGGLKPLPKGAKIDTLMIESTRGAQAEGPSLTFEGEVDRFAKEIARVLKQNGIVLVPCFALGRTQELLNVISRLVEHGRVPDVPIYASGLGRAVYELYMRYTDYLQPETAPRPLKRFKRIGDVWERSVRKELLKKPCIIVATSGMMVENTPSAMLAQDLVRDKKHGIFFVGYLDPDTMGYKLLHANAGDELVFELSGRPVRVELENRQRFHFSAHAHRKDLLWLIEHTNPRNLVFVHGDDDAIGWMRENTNGRYRTFTPSHTEDLVLEA